MEQLKIKVKTIKSDNPPYHCCNNPQLKIQKMIGNINKSKKLKITKLLS